MNRYYYFPLAFMANSLAMTALLIFLGLAGRSGLVADIGIVQGITLALFYSFSANARNLILNQVTPIGVQSLLAYRLALILPLAGLAYWLARSSGVDPLLAIVLLIRRSVEWLDEIYLSEMERTDRKSEVVGYIGTQAMLLVLALGWMLSNMPFPLLGIFLWALLPLLLSGRFYFRLENFRTKIPTDILRKISPHIGSTAIIGITVYVFRLLLIDIGGKEVAADLFVAFAMGGVLGSVVANAFGPSLVLAQSKSNTHKLPGILKALMAAFFVIGVLVIQLSESPYLFGKSSLFWLAVGFSMIGAAPMVLAQLVRHRLLQHHEDQDLFGPDVLINVLLVALVPLVYYLFGYEAMATLYLLSAVLAWFFYKSYESHENGYLASLETRFPFVKSLLAGLLVLPVFFQFGSGVFQDTAMLFDTHREIARLPIPISTLVIFAILLFVSNVIRARVALVFAFFTFVLMIAALIISTPPDSIQQQSKFVLLAQFILPIFALISGQVFEGERDVKHYILEKSIFYVLMLMVPMQILSSWLQGYALLVPSIHVFSVYQHLHYVPIMFVAAYMFVFHRLWQTAPKPALLLLTVLMAIYVVMTASLFISMAYFIGLFIYSICLGRFCKARNFRFYFVLACVMGLVYWKYANALFGHTLFNTQGLEYSVGLLEKVMIAWQQKTTIWGHYLNLVLNDPQTLLVGHAGISERGQFGSAHHYYLDLVYNFGLVGLLPLLVLLGYTGYMMYVNNKVIMRCSALFFPGLTLLFLLLIENFFYMGLKQPYPGILTFFLWGILLNRLRTPNN